MRLHFLWLLLFPLLLAGQSDHPFADSIRKTHAIPELGYAVVSSSGIKTLHVSGIQKTGSPRPASPDDRFRIGSNTKAVTGLIAARLVKQGRIRWDTRFFTLFPELEKGSAQEHKALTLLDLLSFRAKLFPYTYTYGRPTRDQFKGNVAAQRYAFTAWFLQQKAVHLQDSVVFSNLGFVAAALMLEKASGQSYQDLVNGLGDDVGIRFGFGPPNASDTLQPWGHDKNLQPEPPGDNYKLNWLQAAGNLNISLPDYARFIQEQLRGLRGTSTLLSQEEYHFLHYGRPEFSIGWFWGHDRNGLLYSYNIGNPGTFLSKVYVFSEKDLAIILFANVQSESADAGLDALFEWLYAAYVK